ncbi:MAG: rod shape-determining protein MreD [Alphaproteobacteria bacterium]|nr:rod shape-determining protein MreD [Alphaproteobacteria bacterium]
MRIAGSGRDVAIWGVRRQWVPVTSILAASLLDTMPLVVTTPLVPDFAFLVLLSWRLLRPEMWPASIALPLGLFNDLVAGHPLGQSMALWTMVFLACELLDSRSGWRDYWLDWLFASLFILFYTVGEWRIGRAMGSGMEFDVLLPQLLLSIFSYPLVARLVVGLDRWRLSR